MLLILKFSKSGSNNHNIKIEAVKYNIEAVKYDLVDVN